VPTSVATLPATRCLLAPRRAISFQMGSWFTVWRVPSIAMLKLPTQATPGGSGTDHACRLPLSPLTSLINPNDGMFVRRERASDRLFYIDPLPRDGGHTRRRVEFGPGGPPWIRSYWCRYGFDLTMQNVTSTKRTMISI